MKRQIVSVSVFVLTLLKKLLNSALRRPATARASAMSSDGAAQNLIAGLIIAIAALAVSVNAQGVVITEIHRDPAAGNKTAIPGGYSHSFVELTNLGADTFYIRDVFLTNGKVVDTIMPVNAVIPGHEDCRFGIDYIPSGATAVILSQSYGEGIEIAPSSIHPIASGTIMLAVNRRNIGGGLANDDGVAVYRGTRAVIDSLIDLAADLGVHISAPLSGKITLSQRQTKGVSIVPASLMLGIGDDGGNRKYVLSSGENLSPGRFDPLRNGVYAEYAANMIAEGTVRCSVAGFFVAGESMGASWRFYSRPSPASGAVVEISAGNFEYQRNFLLTFDVTPEKRQYYFDIQDGAGRVTSFPIDLSSFWAAAGTLVISELYPKGGTAAAGQPDWFELHNVSPADVNLNGWTFSNSKDTEMITASDFILPSGGFLVVTRDDAAMRSRYRSIERMIRPVRWLTLNSTNDTVTIRSPHGVEVDRAVYRSAWFSGWTTQSLERVYSGEPGIDSMSWVLCDRPTPGLPGSASLWRSASSPFMEIGPVPFKPNGDGVDDLLSIRMNIPPNYRAKIRIFGFDGKPLKTFSGEREHITWDGRTDAGRLAPPGVIYVVAEFTSGNNVRRIVRKRGVLWR